MGDHYYGIMPGDVTSSFGHYNLISQSQYMPQQHQLQQQFAAMGQSIPLGDCELLPTTSPGYFSDAINSKNIDFNNNNNNNLNLQVNRNYCYQQNQNNYNNIYNSKDKQWESLKYTNANMNYMPNMGSSAFLKTSHNKYGSIMATSTDMPSMHNHHMMSIGSSNPGTGGSGCHYSNIAGISSCYNRNRYMPYNHNRVCAAAAAANAIASGAGSTMSKSAITSFNAHNHFVPLFYANGSSNLPMSIAPIAPTISTGEQPLHTSVYSRTAVTSNSLEYNNCMPNLTSISSNSAGSPPTMQCSNEIVLNGVDSSGNCTSNRNNATSASTICNFKMSSSYSTASRVNDSGTSTTYSTPQSNMLALSTDPSDTVTLQITNLDYSMDEATLRVFLMNQLKPITPVVSLTFEGSSYAKVTVPDLFFAKQVVSNLHRKKVGHKRMLVSYTRDSSLTEINTLRCQVAGLLKDVPYFTLPMYKFRELFQSRFKTSISVLDLYKMQDICTINSDNNEDKFISLQPELLNSLESSPLVEGLQHSVPYCPIHFKREQHKGWADQEIEPLPNVFMTKSEIQQIIYPLLKKHPGDVPVASLVHCIESELGLEIKANENGVNLEHLVCCVQGIQIHVNNFGIKILGWLEPNKEKETTERHMYAKNAVSDPLYQISREVIELVKMSPKSTMKFSRFIPAYHNHFGKQCRVADYGYTKLIELFEALSSVVQILGDGENRQITLTHRIQIRRFTSDLLRVLRAHGNNSVLLSQLPTVFAQTQNRNFDITDYGVCDIVDILDGLVNSNIVVVSNVQKGRDILISIPKRKQTSTELEKTCVFAGEMVELFRNAVQYTILFQKFVRSYHYHFAYQCRLSDYGFLKLADLIDSIHGVVEMELTNDEDKKIYLSPKVARRVFAEQCEELIRTITGSSTTSMELDDVLKFHKKKYGYQIQPQTLGVTSIREAIKLMPYIKWIEKDGKISISCHTEDTAFRSLAYKAAKYLLNMQIENPPNKSKSLSSNSADKTASKSMPLKEFIKGFNLAHDEKLCETILAAMGHAIEIYTEHNEQFVKVTSFIKFLMQIVRILEEKSSMILHELKNALDFNLTTTFEFGFPNLYTVLVAYSDLFSVKTTTSQERSEVSLLPNCELHLSGAACQHVLYNAAKVSLGKQKSTARTRPCQMSGPPAKTRILATENSNIQLHNETSIHSISNFKSNSNIFNQSTKSTKLQQTIPKSTNQQPLINKTTNTKQSKNNSFNQSSIYSNASQLSTLHTSSMSNSSNGSNKENSFNTSFNMLNGSFNASSANTSNTDLQNSFNSMAAEFNFQFNHADAMYTATVPPPNISSKLWDRRQSTSSYGITNSSSVFNQQNQYPEHYQDFNSSLVKQQSSMLQKFTATMLPTSTDLINLQKYLPNSQNETGISAKDKPQSCIYEIVNNMQICPAYQPPKPDTPPSDVMPFWIDPIWSNIAEKEENCLSNIRLPEMKSMNVLPMLLSPYTLSKTENSKQPGFNFDNHDRKIA